MWVRKLRSHIGGITLRSDFRFGLPRWRRVHLCLSCLQACELARGVTRPQARAARNAAPKFRREAVTVRRAKTMSEAARKKRPCAACGARVGTATIVAGGEYPDAPLCLECGTRRDWDEVRDMIRKRLPQTEEEKT
jgi:hypothetical protein